ncbi:hypothetical protein PA25_01560 [Pseudoalteromonas sp. A25]|uniref:hypothetical protein n=1 Tax=Pseudoalteromonas sp. A25 TaxID=116092 RepID=UPI001260EC56|nr:hypothetical protein [Pseudoalteromonas sp. A25]BBN80171.1 hypothetical protein PA25_01560 [Pseudoalteromonas sp. A25]
MDIFSELQDACSAKEVIELIAMSDGYSCAQDQNRLVLKDTIAHRLVLYKGANCFGATLCNSAPHSVCVLQGTLRLKTIPIMQVHLKSGGPSNFIASGAMRLSSLSAGDAQQLNTLEVFDFQASHDAHWLVLYDKSVSHYQSAKLCAVTFRPVSSSLLDSGNLKIVKSIQHLSSATCEESFQALLKLCESDIEAIAWQAIEGVYLRDRYKAAQLVSEYQLSHSCELIRHRVASIPF